jgi:putative N-acetyltransferase (TIGR04045 family)
MKPILCRPVKGSDEREEYFRIRKKVFVEEQGMFSRSDRDRHDGKAIHIIAVAAEKVVGTVRVYEREKGLWYGGRLAVLNGYRGRVGRLLVTEAVRTVRKKRASRFLAYVQPRNVLFFRRLGWHPVGVPTAHHGKPHQLMEAHLKETRDGTPPKGEHAQRDCRGG